MKFARLSIFCAFALRWAVALVGLTGCGKSQSSSPPPATSNSAAVNVAVLNRSLLSSQSPQVHQSLSDFLSMMRASNFEKAAADLDTIAADPSLTEDQKKAVSDAQEQLKKLLSSDAPKPAQ